MWRVTEVSKWESSCLEGFKIYSFLSKNERSYKHPTKLPSRMSHTQMAELPTKCPSVEVQVTLKIPF